MPPRARYDRLLKISRSIPSRNGSWVCSRCRNNSQWRSNHTTTPATKPPKPYYVTSPIFYVNAAPHVGHLYTIVLADILKRWNALLGRESILCTGTDEHGMKIQRAASKEGKDARSFCDDMYQPFKDLADRANVDYNHFVRTSEPEHRFVVQHFWLLLSQRGMIYSKKHEGWYSVSDETFYPDSAVGMTIDPRTGRKHMASVETGKEVEWTSELNYHFRMSVFKDRLLEYYQKHPNFIVPETRMNAVVQEVSAGLSDLSISRPRERLTWGIPVPSDETQTIYVWLDALINYLTKAKYPFQIPGQERAGGWPADCQVIGKDIIRFHCIYWPAFLMALDLPLPRRILTHAHWTLGRQKMSKSSGVAVNPFSALDRFGTDPMRFYLAHDGGIKDDASYDNSFIIQRYQNSLLGSFGNLLNRVISSKRWNVRACIENYAGVIRGSNEEFRNHLENLPDRVAESLAVPDPGAGLRKIMRALQLTNAYLTHEAPWSLYDIDDRNRRQICIYSCAEALRICGILMQPYMPSKATALLDVLGVAKNARAFKDARYGEDIDFGNIQHDFLKGPYQLFPPLTSYF